MLARLSIDFDGTDKQLLRRINNVLIGLDDLTEQNRKALEIAQKSIKHRFDTEGEGSWKKLNSDYAAAKTKRYGFQTINRRTKRLERSLTEDTSDTIKDVGKFYANLGSKVPYFAAVNKLRPIAVLGANTKREIGDLYKRDITQIVRREGF